MARKLRKGGAFVVKVYPDGLMSVTRF